MNQDNLNDNLLNINPPKKLGAGHGWQWVNEGFRYFTYSKYRWISTIFTLIFSVMLLMYYVPILQLALIIIWPLITAGLGLACREIEQGGQINVSFLVKGFVHPHAIHLIRYGFWLILLMIIAQMIGSVLLGIVGISQQSITTELELLKNSNNASFQSIMASPVLLKYFALSFVMMLPITAINLVSPFVLVFSKLSALQAIKFSFVAVIKNIKALLVYALVFIVIIFFVVMLLKGINAILFAVLSKDSSIASIISLVVTLTSIVFIACLSYCSAYVAFKDMFVNDELLGEET